MAETYYELFQLERYGDILPASEDQSLDHEEDDTTSIERAAELALIERESQVGISSTYWGNSLNY